MPAFACVAIGLFAVCATGCEKHKKHKDEVVVSGSGATKKSSAKTNVPDNTHTALGITCTECGDDCKFLKTPEIVSMKFHDSYREYEDGVFLRWTSFHMCPNGHKWMSKGDKGDETYHPWDDKIISNY